MFRIFVSSVTALALGLIVGCGDSGSDANQPKVKEKSDPNLKPMQINKGGGDKGGGGKPGHKAV